MEGQCCYFFICTGLISTSSVCNDRGDEVESTGLIHHTLVPIDPVPNNCICPSIPATMVNGDEGCNELDPYRNRQFQAINGWKE